MRSYRVQSAADHARQDARAALARAVFAALGQAIPEGTASPGNRSPSTGQPPVHLRPWAKMSATNRTTPARPSSPRPRWSSCRASPATG